MGEKKNKAKAEINEIKKTVESKTQKSVVVPEYLTASSRFKFRCYPGIGCFTKCCSGIRIILSPYDIFRLKNRLGKSCLEFLNDYTIPMTIEGSSLQTVGLKMKDDEIRSCPFVTAEGCTVYTDRPLTCRYYPIGMGMMKKDTGKTGEDFFIKVKEDHCLGHNEETVWTIKEWRQDQESDLYDEMNNDWMAIVLKAKTLGRVEFSQRSLELFYIVSTNLDLFRDMAFSPRFIAAYQLDPETLKTLAEDELELLKFSLKWLRFVTFDEGDFKVDQEARKKAKEKLISQAEEERKRQREEAIDALDGQD
ncbi:MAG: YkgJ family cysteine cluster protein [Nitrospiraceae bacterium]|nr:YkgJ family cysteine cluster protein [Nitrospiraceae bacterium]